MSSQRRPAFKRLAHLLSPAYADDAKECHARFAETWARRSSNPIHAGAAIDVIARTEYWRELGHSNLDGYVSAQCGAEARDAYGMRVLWQCREVDALLRLVERGYIEMERLAALSEVMTPANAPYWLPLLIHLRRSELEIAADSYRRHRTGLSGPLVFVPLWLPLQWYHEVWHPAEAGRPAFEVLKSLTRNKS